MKEINALIYISDDCRHCADLITYLDKWNIDYEVKNVSRDSQYMKELQRVGIYGTPATFVNKSNEAILGFHKSKLKQMLGIEPTVTHIS